jgi:four helix bundle protein
MSQEMVIFTRTFDFLQWIIPHAEKFPKSQRFVITKRLLDAALDFQELLFDANAFRGQVRLQYLRQASGMLDRLRMYLHLAFQFRWLSVGQYEHVSQQVKEIGDLLGGWIKQTQQTLSTKRT